MPKALAYFLTWTTRGTWLHGDDRGSWQRTNPHQRAEFIPEDTQLHNHQSNRTIHNPIVLTPPMRRTVERAIREVVDRRGWDLKALNVRTNHAHAVISARDHAPETILAQLKSWSTRALREAGLIDPDRPVWTRHGSTRLMWDDASVAAACRYVTGWQDGPRFQSESGEVNRAQR